MLNNRNIYCLLLAIACLASSCEKAIDINVPPVARKISVNCNTEIGQPFNITVGRTGSIKENKYFTNLDILDASIALYVNDSMAETIAYNPNTGYFSTVVVEPGKKYSVKVKAPTYNDVEASVTVPVRVLISSITRTPNARRDDEGKMQDAVVITFDDPAATNDFYIVRLNFAQNPNQPFGGSYCVNSSDPGIETSASDLVDANTCLDNNGIFIRDGLFNGRKKELTLYVNSDMVRPFENGPDTIYANVELLHVPEAFFRYEKSNRVAMDANGNPFAEPANVYTNVVGGYGIFAAYSTDRMDIR